MQNFILTVAFILITIPSYAQYPFEKYPAIKYKEYKGWKLTEGNGLDSINCYKMSIPNFFDKKDTLTILLIANDSWDSSYFILYRNQQQIAKYVEPIFHFNEVNMDEPIRLADINGDHLTDIKLSFLYLGNGITSLDNRIIYLFQQKDKSFKKISFRNMVDGTEKDFNHDCNYEIITMSLERYGSHSYWLFNLFNFNGHDLVSVNSKFNYPIMIQFLNRNNYKITDKISRQKMKEFGLKLPEDYSRE